MSAPSSESSRTPATPPGLPDLSKLPEEERDAAWLKHYYKGERPQLTVRAVVMGGLLGMAMAVSNLYTTLKVGWAFGVAITACVLSYVIWNAAVAMRLAKTKMTILENNCMQSTASAAGYSTGGTLAVAVGAMLLITGDDGRLGWVETSAWVFFVALLGVLLAIPMKRQMINGEQLAFPSGIAAAQTLESLYAEGKEAVLKARALVIALFGGAGWGIALKLGLVRDAVEMPFRLFSARRVAFTGPNLAGFVFEPSALLIAAGMIVGIRISTWMLIGSLINYLVLMPVALGMPDWVEEGKRFFGHVEAVGIPGVEFAAGATTLDDAGYDAAAEQALATLESSEAIEALVLSGSANADQRGTDAIAHARAENLRSALIERGVPAERLRIAESAASPGGAAMVSWLVDAPEASVIDAQPPIAIVRVTRWSLWLGSALLVTAGLTSFAVGYRTILRALRGLGRRKEGDAAADPVAHLEVPFSWFLIGMAPVTIGLIIVCAVSFSIAWWLGLVSVLLSFPLALVACRATGETDTTPIGAMGKITQFVYAVIAPGNITANLMTAGVTAGAAGSSADLLTDLKSGYLLGANPRQQFLAQLAGVFFGVPAVVFFWYLLVPNQAALEAYPLPATRIWEAVARALSQGIHVIPESARWAIVLGGLAGVILSLLEALAPKKIKPWVPSSMGLGLAFIVPFANALSFFIGACITEVWSRVHKESAERYIIAVASGAIAGESLAVAGFAVFETIVGLLG